MLPGAHALQAFVPKDVLEIQRGSCVRHRFAKSNCRHCFDVCPSNALEWCEDGLHWDSGRCQECLLCAASCPSGALSGSEISFVALLQDLTDIEQPILACSTASKTTGHARLPCLGALANSELLLAMSLALGRPLRLNISACTDCRNVAVVTPLIKTRQRLAGLQLPKGSAAELVFDASTLDYEERNCSRREFFSLLRNRSRRASICVVDRLKVDPQSASYGTKQLPASRKLLLQVLQQLPETREQIAGKLFPQRVSSDSCQNCTGCVGICPTGALIPPAEAGIAPDFSAECCIACRLCEDFCAQSGITINSSD
jgi:ferredoxin